MFDKRWTLRLTSMSYIVSFPKKRDPGTNSSSELTNLVERGCSPTPRQISTGVFGPPNLCYSPCYRSPQKRFGCSYHFHYTLPSFKGFCFSFLIDTPFNVLIGLTYCSGSNQYKFRTKINRVLLVLMFIK